MYGEPDIIKTYFSCGQPLRKDIKTGIGDDCAIVEAPRQRHLAITTDTLIEGTHFVKGAPPKWVAYRALAASVSDLAAMGATPIWCSLAITLPRVDKSWIQEFSLSFFDLAKKYNIQLIGGDTTKGPLSITITAQGSVAPGKAILRSGAQVGDWIYVTGFLGDSQAGLEVVLDDRKRSRPFASHLEVRHYVSTPRISTGQSLSLSGLASSAIDISDGLVTDLQHVLSASCVGARLNLEDLPISGELLQYLYKDKKSAYRYALTSGEEYELCFTVPDSNKVSLTRILAQTGTKLSCIGQVQSPPQLSLYLDGDKTNWNLSGYDHFSN